MAEVLRGKATGREIIIPRAQKQSLVKKTDIKRIYKNIFEGGVIVVHKWDKFLSHPELEGIPNLHVNLVVRSLFSRGFVTENFCWQHKYFTLTEEGVDFLRSYLCLATNVIPNTHQQAAGDQQNRGDSRAQN